MGTIRTVKRKKGVTYRAEIYVNGTREGKTFTDEIEARIWARDREKQLRTGETPPGEIQTGDKVFSEAIDQFIVETRGQVSRSQSTNYEFAKRPLIAFLGEKILMSKITKADMLEYILHRQRTVGVSSIRNELSLVRKVYNYAEIWSVLLPSPEINIKRPTRRKPSREEKLDKIISADDLGKIFDLAKTSRNDTIWYFLRVLLYTGMRPTECASMYWERLPRQTERDYINRRLPVGYVDLKRGGFSLVGTKTQPRFVPAHDEVVYCLECLADKRAGKLVFLDDKYINRPVPYQYYRRAFMTALSKAGISANFYSFRHTMRSALEACGVPSAIGEAIIGHDTGFAHTYIHLSDDVLLGWIKKLEF